MMRKESFQGILLGIVIMCAVFAFITIAWAGFSSTLTINGTATVSAQKWQIEFTNSPDTSLGASALPAAVTNTKNIGTATIDSTANQFVLTSNAVAGVAAAGSGTTKKLGTLNQSGDKIYYQWYIQNFGTFRADIAFSGVLSAANAGGGNIALTCTKTADSSSETTLCNNNIVGKLYVSDYVDVTSGSYNPDTEASLGTLVLSGTTSFYVPAATTSDNTDVKLVTLVLEFNETTPGTSVVSNDELAITMGDITLTATQHTGS